MSVAEGLKRVLDIRNAIRGKMVALGLSQGNDNFDQVKTSVENIIDNTKKTDTATAIQGVFSSGQTGAVFSTGLQGYSSDASMVKVPVSNLASENIKEGVNIGGVIGSVKDAKECKIVHIPTDEDSMYIKGTATKKYSGYPILLILQGAERGYSMVINIYSLDDLQYNAYRISYSVSLGGDLYSDMTEKVVYSKSGSGNARTHTLTLRAGTSGDPELQTSIKLDEGNNEITFSSTYAYERKYGVMVHGYIPQ